jgi:hypothetical protein
MPARALRAGIHGIHGIHGMFAVRALLAALGRRGGHGPDVVGAGAESVPAGGHAERVPGPLEGPLGNAGRRREPLDVPGRQRPIGQHLLQDPHGLGQGGRLVLVDPLSDEVGGGVLARSFPHHPGDAVLLVVDEPVGERVRHLRQVALGHGDDAAAVVVGIGRHQQPAPGGADDADAAAAAVQRAALALVHMRTISTAQPVLAAM